MALIRRQFNLQDVGALVSGYKLCSVHHENDLPMSRRFAFSNVGAYERALDAGTKRLTWPRLNGGEMERKLMISHRKRSRLLAVRRGKLN
jgi:hypothetical protein